MERDKNKSSFHIDEDAFELLYRKFYPRLHNFACKITREESVSQDMVHEVFLKFWEKRKIIEGNSYSPLLFKMTRNMCLNHLKHIKLVENKTVDLKSSRMWEELYRIEFVKDEPYELIENELEVQFRGILDDLPSRCKEVFILSRENGMKNSEIAQELNLSLKAIEKNITYALRVLRAKLILPAFILLFSIYW